MKIIEVHKRALNLQDYVKRSAVDADYDTLIEESCILVDADTKKILVVYTQLDLDDEEIMWALNTIRYDSTTRAGGLKTTSRIFGHSPRLALRKDFCSTTSLAQEFPKQHAAVCRYGQRIAGLYQKYQPEAYKEHLEILTAKVLDEYKIKDTPFTSGIINKNNPLKYHFDSGNFKGVYSCMVVFKKDVEGGHLSLPEYNVGFKLPHNSVFMFDGQSILHGVTPIKRLSTRAQRYSIVYYSLQQMWNCLPLSEELARIRQVKTEREARRLRIMQGKEDFHPAVLRTMEGGKKRLAKKAKKNENN